MSYFQNVPLSVGKECMKIYFWKFKDLECKCNTTKSHKLGITPCLFWDKLTDEEVFDVGIIWRVGYSDKDGVFPTKDDYIKMKEIVKKGYSPMTKADLEWWENLDIDKYK